MRFYKVKKGMTKVAIHEKIQETIQLNSCN
jgi:hypothetical protein